MRTVLHSILLIFFLSCFTQSIHSIRSGTAGVDYPQYTRPPKTSFKCKGRENGYYTDPEAGCQGYHVCHNGRKHSFVCPVTTLFSQELKTCDYWYNVDCEKEKEPEKQESQRQLITVKEIPTHIIVTDRARINEADRIDPRSGRQPPSTTSTTTTTTTTTTPEPTTVSTTEEPTTTTEATTEKYRAEVRREIWVMPLRPQTTSTDANPVTTPVTTETNAPQGPTQSSQPSQSSSPPSNPSRKRNTQGQSERGLIGAMMKWMSDTQKYKPESEKQFNETYRTSGAFAAPTEGPEVRDDHIMPPEFRRGQPSYRRNTQQSFELSPTPVYLPDSTRSSGQQTRGLTSPSPLQEPPPQTTEGTLYAPPYDYPFQPPSFHQDYVDPKGRRMAGPNPGLVPDENLIPQESVNSDHLYINHHNDHRLHRQKSNRPTLPPLTEKAGHPNPWLFPAREVEETTTTTTSTLPPAPQTTPVSPKWTFASSTVAPHITMPHNIYAAPDTGSAFDMHMKETDDNTSPAPSHSKRDNPSGVQERPAPEFREFIVGEVTGGGECRCPVDPDVYFRRR